MYVEFKAGRLEAARGLIQQAGGRIHFEFDGLNAVATTVPEAALAGLRNNPNVVQVEEDPPRRLDSCSLPAETIPYGLDAVQATDVWDSNPADGAFDNGAPRGNVATAGPFTHQN